MSVLPRSLLGVCVKASLSVAVLPVISANIMKTYLPYMANVWPVFSQYLAVKEAKRWGIPVVLHIQDIYPESMLGQLGIVGRMITWPLLKLDRIILQNASIVLAISEDMKSYLSNTQNLEDGKVHLRI